MKGCLSRPTSSPYSLALGDHSIESGDDSGGPLPITTEQIAGKFIRYYWRQAIPYVAPTEARVLQQNTGKQAAIVNLVQAARQEHDDSLAAAMNNGAFGKRWCARSQA